MGFLAFKGRYIKFSILNMVILIFVMYSGKEKKVEHLQSYLHRQQEKKNTKISVPMMDDQFKGYWPNDIKLFKDFLHKKANKDNIVILLVVDVPFVDMAINLYETSFKKLNITNYIFFGAHEEATKMLQSQNFDALTGWNDTEGETSSNFGSKHFFRKNLYKTIGALVALKLGYNVLVMDVDIILLKNPFELLKCNTCDIIFSTEGNTHRLNAGFYLAFNKTETIILHQSVIEKVIKSNFLIHEQESFNSLIHTQKKIKVLRLDYKLFQNGRDFFEVGKRMFAHVNPCDYCVSIHNNYIRSHSHKVYRFREHLMWLYESGDQYYSSKNRKYITYKNRYYFGEKETMKAEDKALKNAFLLGFLLNRTVILPKFFCYLCSDTVCYQDIRTALCATNIHFNIHTLDIHLKNKYREHMFLSHPKVPENVKSSISKQIILKTDFYLNMLSQQNDQFRNEGLVIQPPAGKLLYEPTYIVKHLEPFSKYYILNFHSLYGDIFENIKNIEFYKTVSNGVKSIHGSNYNIVKFLVRVP